MLLETDFRSFTLFGTDFRLSRGLRAQNPQQFRTHLGQSTHRLIGLGLRNVDYGTGFEMKLSTSQISEHISGCWTNWRDGWEVWVTANICQCASELANTSYSISESVLGYCEQTSERADLPLDWPTHIYEADMYHTIHFQFIHHIWRAYMLRQIR